MIKGFDHVALSVSNFERSLVFYRDLLGFNIIRIIECPPERGLGNVVGISGCSARIAHLEVGNSILEIFEYLDPRGKKIPEDHKQADHGYTHIGFISTNIQADYKHLHEHGIKCFSEPIEFRPGVWIFYFYGPDGEVCELKES